MQRDYKRNGRGARAMKKLTMVMVVIAAMLLFGCASKESIVKATPISPKIILPNIPETDPLPSPTTLPPGKPYTPKVVSSILPRSQWSFVELYYRVMKQWATSVVEQVETHNKIQDEHAKEIEKKTNKGWLW